MLLHVPVEKFLERAGGLAHVFVPRAQHPQRMKWRNIYHVEHRQLREVDQLAKDAVRRENHQPLAAQLRQHQRGRERLDLAVSNNEAMVIQEFVKDVARLGRDPMASPARLALPNSATAA